LSGADADSDAPTGNLAGGLGCLAWILGPIGTAVFFGIFLESDEPSGIVAGLWVPLSIWLLLLLCFNRQPQQEARAKEEAAAIAAKKHIEEAEAAKKFAEKEKKREASKRRAEAEKNRNPEHVPARIPRDADDFETVCAEWMKKAGFSNVERTPKGPDGGIDTIASDAVGQAKFHPSQKVTGESVRALVGSKIERKKKRALFFHYGPGYTPDAIAAARKTGVELYQLDVDKRRFKRIDK